MEQYTQKLEEYLDILQQLTKIDKRLARERLDLVNYSFTEVPGSQVQRNPQIQEQVTNFARNFRELKKRLEKQRGHLEGREIAPVATVTVTKAQAEQDYQQKKQRVLELFDKLQQQYRNGTCPWQEDLSPPSPIDDMHELPLLRIGEAAVAGGVETVSMPVLLRLIGSKNLIIEAAACKDRAILAIQSTMLRLLMSLPPSRLRFLMIDPVGVGANFAGFMHLPEEAVSGKIWTDSLRIEQQLAKLCDHMENIIQKYLLNQYKSMEEYNEKAGEVAEPYRLLAVANFPANFSEQSAQRLLSIAQNGPRSGIYTLIHIDSQRKMPHNFSLADLRNTATVLTEKEGKFYWHNSTWEKFPIVLDTPPSQELFTSLVQKVANSFNDASKVEVPYDKFITDIYSEWWRETSAKSLSVPVGRAGARDIQYFTLGKDLAQHAILVGKTGSGKSTLLNILILSIAIAYSPEEVQLYLIDFKEGVEFKKYAQHDLPHALVIAIQSEREFGLSVLQGLEKELERRGNSFRQLGVNSIQEYRSETKEKLPRILLVVDEFQEFFIEEDTMAYQVRTILERLVRKGRAYGIHILLASQSLAGAGNLPRAIRDQIAVRIALQCSDSDSRSILGDDNAAAKYLNRPGEAIYNAANGLVEGNSLFQTFWLEKAKMESFLGDIRQYAERKTPGAVPKTIIFEGNAPGELENNAELRKLFRDKDEQKTSTKIWLGEPTTIKSHTHFILHSQTGANILLIGQNEEIIAGMVISSLLSLMAQFAPSAARFYIVNLGFAEASWQELLPVLSQGAHQIHLCSKRRDVVGTIDEIEQLLEPRLQAQEISAAEDYVFFFFIGLQRARDLYKDGYSLAPATQKWMSILRDGPEVGLHSFVCSDTYSNVERSLDRSCLKEFDIRIALHMNASNSTTLIDTSAASKLDMNRALLYNEEGGTLEKFRPYEAPMLSWLESTMEELRQKEGKHNV